MSRVTRLLLASVSVLASLALPASTRLATGLAQERPRAEQNATAPAPSLPSDVLEAGGVAPPPPHGYVVGRVAGIRWIYHRSAAREVEPLIERAPITLARLSREVGLDAPPAVEVRVANGPTQMRRLAPPQAPPPPYASGVAYGDLRLVILTLTAPETWQRPSLEHVLDHELSHIVVRAAAPGARVPRWFVEGLAIHQAEEPTMDRTRVLWEAAVRDTVIPLAHLDRSFPARSHEVSLAYAQSADIVRYLLVSAGPHRLPRLFASMRAGRSFDRALREAFATTPASLEQRWREGLKQRFRTLPLLLGGTTIWALVVVLLALAWVKSRRRARQKLRVMEATEREEDAALARAFKALDRAAEQAREDEATSLARRIRDGEVIAAIPRSAPGEDDPEIPKVEHDGRHHTLH
ncbi:MAG: hypothetical protein IT379_18905 [Deltaproteobacteria bacterium]|nr:hypothetical protein [Deltaproteobacteria bacterium]